MVLILRHLSENRSKDKVMRKDVFDTFQFVYLSQC